MLHALAGRLRAASRFFGALITLTLLQPNGVRADAEKPSAYAFGCTESIHDVQISPDGNHVAFLLSDGGPSSLAVYHLATGKTEILFQGSPLGFAYAWKGSTRILAFQNRGTRRVVVSVSPGAKELTAFPNYGTERQVYGVFDWMPADPNHILVATKFGQGIMDATTGEIVTTSSSEGTIGGMGYVSDLTGVIRLRFQQNREGIDLEHRETDKALFQPVYHWTWDEPLVDDLGFGANPKVAYFLTYTEGNWGEIRPFDLSLKKFNEAIIKGNGAQLEGAIFAPDRSRIIGVRTNVSYGRKDFWLDPTVRLLQATVDASLPKRRNLIASLSNDFQVAVVISIKNSEPGDYMLIDRHKGSLTRLGPQRTQVDYSRLVAAQAVEIAARDGLKIYAVLLEPKATPGPHALIVIPRSNPFGSRHGTYYNWESQYLVSLGYAVLEVDYRGSDGYGRSFAEAGRHQFARKIPNDIEDATRWSLEHHFTAPGRIGILGVGDGATQALIAATQNPELYASVVNWNGEADLTRIEYPSNQSWMARKIIDYFYSDDPAALEAKSAQRFMSRLTASILNIYPSHRDFPDGLTISQGKMVYNDADVNERRGRVERALSSAHGPAATVPSPKPSEVASNRDAAIYYYSQIGAFLRRSLPPTG